MSLAHAASRADGEPPQPETPINVADRVAAAVTAYDQPIALYRIPSGEMVPVTPNGEQLPAHDAAFLAAVLPGLSAHLLGSASFSRAHRCDLAYIVGEMARGIATARMTIAAANAGLLGFFGSAGLPPAEIETAIHAIKSSLGPDKAWGMNLIHSPDQPDQERCIADLFIHEGVERVSASAFMSLSPDVVRLSAKGLRAGSDGSPVRARHVFAKISRPEVAKTFMQPPPDAVLRDLVSAGALSETEATLQSSLPIASAITVEADSGGHTDNRPMAALFPMIQALCDDITAQFAYTQPIPTRPPPQQGFRCTAGPCSQQRALLMSQWHRPPICSNAESRFKCSNGGRYSPLAPAAFMISGAATHPLTHCLVKTATSSSGRSCASLLPLRGLPRGSTSEPLTRHFVPGPTATHGSKWPASSGATSSSRLTGHGGGKASVRLIFRSGAAQPWARSTPGLRAHISKRLRRALSDRSGITS